MSNASRLAYGQPPMLTEALKHQTRREEQASKARVMKAKAETKKTSLEAAPEANKVAKGKRPASASSDAPSSRMRPQLTAPAAVAEYHDQKKKRLQTAEGSMPLKGAARMPVRAAAALDGFYVAASFEATAQEALRACARPKTAPVLKKLLCQKTQALIQIQSEQVSLALSPDGEALADRELGNPWDESDAPIAERSWRAIIVGFVGGKFADKNKEVQVVVCQGVDKEDGGKLAKPLPAGDVPGAVTSDVAVRLHARASELAFERGGDVGAGNRWAPASLREDLARAVGSNATKVDASGECGREHTTLPVVVKSMCDTLVDRVQSAIMALAAEDESGTQYLSPGVARKLAADAVLGRYKVVDYLRDARTMLGRSAPREGSIGELRGWWRLLRCALMAASEPLFGMTHNDAGVGKLESRINASTGSFVMDVRSLQQMLRRVFDSWELRQRRRRCGRSCKLQGCSGGVRRGAGGERRQGVAAVGDRSRDGVHVARESSEVGWVKKGAPMKKEAEGGALSGWPCVWPDKPKLDADAFEKFCAAVRTECAEACHFFLIGAVANASTVDRALRREHVGEHRAAVVRSDLVGGECAAGRGGSSAGEEPVGSVVGSAPVARVSMVRQEEPLGGVRQQPADLRQMARQRVGTEGLAREGGGCVDGLRRRRALVLFAGRPRWGSLTHALQEAGWEVVEMDTLIGGEAHDLSRGCVQEAVCRDVQGGEFELIWMGPEGIQPVPPAWRGYLMRHNGLVGLAVRVAALTCGPSARQLARSVCAEWVSFPQCAFGGEFQKWTTLMAAGPGASALRQLQGLACTHVRHGRRACGVGALGALESAEAGGYHALKSRAAADLLQGVDGCGSCWVADPAAMPLHLDERADVLAGRADGERARELQYISRRRSEPVDVELMAREEFAGRRKHPDREARPAPSRVRRPEGAPEGRIAIAQLYYHAGVYDEIRGLVRRISSGLKSAEIELSLRGAVGCEVPRVASGVFEAEVTQPEWARACVWNTSNPEDCVPLQPFTEGEPPEQQADVAAGWILPGREDLWTMPARVVPRNMVLLKKWKWVEDELKLVDKWRLTTDDSMEASESVASRNAGIDPSDMGTVDLPHVRSLARAVAIVKSMVAVMGIRSTEWERERVALWALDLTNAYRMVASARHERWLQ
ncbi:MAG: hypothetical protein SGPRY_001078 [Prymnesium sp.]